MARARRGRRFFALAVLAAAAHAEDGATVGWAHYGGDPGGRQYTPAAQLTPANVGRLERAWVHRSGEPRAVFARKQHTFEATPVLWAGTLYFTTGTDVLIAVDARSGVERWRFDPGLDPAVGYGNAASRGVALWHGEAASCPHRVLFGTLVGELLAVDAETGRPCPDFGRDGRIALRDAEVLGGADPADVGEYAVTSPPAILGDLAFVGSAIGDNRAADLERGIVRAVDVRTGAERWRWDPIPRDPDDPAATDWASDTALRTGAANAWAPLSVDPERGLLFVPTSSPSPDFYGGERLGDNRYANSLLALEAATGRVVWHRQLVHHDVWDYDVPAQPTLVDLPRDAGTVPAVLVATKTGMLFAFHRETGEALFPVDERPVPASDVAGEVLSPTQPYSTLPELSGGRALGPDDAWGLLYFDTRACRRILERYRSEGRFTPPSLRGSILYPGWGGGANWGGVAVDPRRALAVVRVNELPGQLVLVPRSEVEARTASGEFDGWEVTAMAGTPYAMARRPFLSPLGVPCIEPPWGRLVAVDLARGTLAWSRPLGTTADFVPGWLPDLTLGIPGLGGPLVTAGGLVLVGGASERALRAFDLSSGEELWTERLPAPANATPMSYVLDGVQYVVVAAGGHGGLNADAVGDHLVAWRLPPEAR